jgi:hypothetical protein
MSTRPRQASEKQVAEIHRGLELFIEPGAVHELRALDVNTGNGWTATFFGYFNNRDLMATAASELSGKAAGVYLTLNPVVPEFLARCANRTKRAKKDNSTKDDEILSRRWLFVDIDAVRPSGISSTDEQHQAALERAWQIRQWLMEECGWPAPVVMDSGNSSYLIFHIALDNNAAASDLVERVLKTLARRFDDAKVRIDGTTFNAARLMRIPGTLNMKGDSTEDRPHRDAKLIDIPSALEIVSREQLEQIASESQDQDSTQPRDSHNSSTGPASASPQLEAVLKALDEQHGITAKGPEPYKEGSSKYILSACLFNSSHGGTSVAIIEHHGRQPAYCCLHDECRYKRKWGDVLKQLKLASAGAATPKVVIEELPDVTAIAQKEVGFIVPQLFPWNAVIALTGASEVGKTHVMLDLTGKISVGAEFLGEKCEQCPVLYLTRENPNEYIADICRRLGIKNGPGTNLHIWGDWCEDPPPIPGDPYIVAWVEKQAAKGVHPFIVVDSLIAFFDGRNENDSAEMRAFINQARRLLRAGACGVALLHHPGKAESAQLYRGSSDLKPAIDAAFSLCNSGDGKLEGLHLKAWKRRYVKQRRELVLHYQELDGKASLVPDTRDQAPRETSAQQLKHLLATNPRCTKKEFGEAAFAKGIPRNQAHRFLDAGVLDGQILREKGAKRAHYYSIKTHASVAAGAVN